MLINHIIDCNVLRIEVNAEVVKMRSRILQPRKVADVAQVSCVSPVTGAAGVMISVEGNEL